MNKQIVDNVDVLKGDINNGFYLVDTGFRNMEYLTFKFVVKWPVVVKRELPEAYSYSVNIRKEEFNSYEEAKRHRNLLISYFDNIRSTIPASEITIEIVEC